MRWIQNQMSTKKKQWDPSTSTRRPSMIKSWPTWMITTSKMNRLYSSTRSKDLRWIKYRKYAEEIQNSRTARRWRRWTSSQSRIKFVKAQEKEMATRTWTDVNKEEPKQADLISQITMQQHFQLRIQQRRGPPQRRMVWSWQTENMALKRQQSSRPTQWLDRAKKIKGRMNLGRARKEASQTSQRRKRNMRTKLPAANSRRWRSPLNLGRSWDHWIATNIEGPNNAPQPTKWTKHPSYLNFNITSQLTASSRSYAKSKSASP